MLAMLNKVSSRLKFKHHSGSACLSIESSPAWPFKTEALDFNVFAARKGLLRSHLIPGCELNRLVSGSGNFDKHGTLLQKHMQVIQ